MSIFPIYQTFHHLAEHFTYDNGYNDAMDAFKISDENYAIPFGTTIYFPVDYDAYEYEAEGIISEYFRGVNAAKVELNNNYEIGIYGSRNTCAIISNQDLAKYSFVSGMSIGFSGNLGFPLPENWSFNQIYEDSTLEIDRDVKSGLDEGFNSQTITDINNNFFNELDFVSMKAEEYLISLEEDITTKAINDLIFDFYRWNRYDGGTWNDLILNEVDQNFCLFVGISSDDRIDEVTDYSTGVTIDVPHMIYGLLGYAAYSYDSYLTNGDFASWGGDYISVFCDFINDDKGLEALEYAKKYCISKAEASGYGEIDFYSDIDGFNIWDRFYSSGTEPLFNEVFKEYLKGYASTRFEYFLEKRYFSDMEKIYEFNLNSLIPTSIHLDFSETVKLFFVNETGQNLQDIDTQIKEDFSKGCTENQVNYFN